MRPQCRYEGSFLNDSTPEWSYVENTLLELRYCASVVDMNDQELVPWLTTRHVGYLREPDSFVKTAI